MVKRYAIIDNVTGKCVNTCLWDGQTPWTPPPGSTAVESTTHQVDKDPEPVAESTEEKLGKQIDALKARIEQLEAKAP